MVQLAPAARLEPQLLVSLKELGLLPKRPKLLIVKAALPVLLSVAICAALVVPAARRQSSVLAG